MRDFDVVTLDRVKRIDITEDYPVWKEYAYRAGVHGAVLAYLEIRKEHFYSIRMELSGKHFVTARGWEDLSRILKVYEELAIPVTKDLILQYIQDEEIAASFAVYYDLYQKYREIYRVPEILEGRFPADTESMKNAPFDEKLSLIGLLADRLNQEFYLYSRTLAVQTELLSQLKAFKEDAGRMLQPVKGDAGRALQPEGLPGLLSERIGAYRSLYEMQRTAGLLDQETDGVKRRVLAALDELYHTASVQDAQGQTDLPFVSSWFAAREDARQQAIAESGRHLTNAFSFLAAVYGESQEMALFLSELAAGYYSLKFVSECGNEAYDKYQGLLLTKDRRREITEELQTFLRL